MKQNLVIYPSSMYMAGDWKTQKTNVKINYYLFIHSNYNSVPLVEELRELGLSVVGTIRAN